MTDQAAIPTAATQPQFLVQAALRTDVGRVRAENQDFGVFTTTESDGDSVPGGQLFLVADGMGGHRGGATASRLAAETVKAQYLGSETENVAEALHEALLRANKRIYSEAQANPDLRGMGTTTSALALRGNQAWFAHVGDSRIYLVRSGEIRQLTDDHSLVASMVREGLLTPKEAENHPRRNVLQRSMGVSEDVEIDVRGPFEVQHADVYIICSDGLHGLVKEDEMKEVARLDVDRAADEYLKRSLERGAPDNVTVIVARIIGADDDGTVRDIRYDETQPLTKIDPLLLDETVRDVPVPAAPAAPKPVVAATQRTLKAPTVETALPALDEVSDEADTDPYPVPKRGGGMMKVLLLIVLLLAVIGGWYFWASSQSQPVSSTSSSSSSR
jgi:serine/threonine protein phosphatase PrpC